MWACLVVLGTGMVGRAVLCAHGRAMPVTRLQASPAADAPSRARRLCRADARSSCEGSAARTKWERVGRAGDIVDACAVVCRVRVSVLRFWDRQLALHCVVLVGGFRSKVASEAPADRVDETIGSLPHRACLAKQDSSVQRNTH
jgi:hypothetical protein